MTFTEWYKNTYNDVWTSNHAPLFSLIEKYEHYCETNGIEPVWNG